MSDGGDAGAQETRAFDNAAILELLPHRYPMQLLDRVDRIEGNLIVGVKTVSAGEPWATGHFPGRPIMPGVLIVEAMAQLAGVYVVASFPPGGEWVPNLTGLDGFRFRRPAVPGDVLELELRMVRGRRGRDLHLYRFEGRATVRGDVVCEGVISAALVLSPGRAEEGAGA